MGRRADLPASALDDRGGGIYKTLVSGSHHQNLPKKQKSSP
nr:MAG TPA: hypothetical protein [Bacteriophage sp.]DAR52135.1 MAG TPA: hypothetical protein [Bacteriophage sp.]